MKIYKGYELMKLASEGKVSLNQKISATNFEYENCTIDFVIKDRAENIMDLSFELIEDEIDIQKIEELDYKEKTETIEQADTHIYLNRCRINELIQIVKQLDKKIEERKK